MGIRGLRYTIHVPRKIELSSIVSSNGRINVESIEGASHLRTSNGSVHASSLTGPLEVQTSNGTVEVRDITGDTTLRSSNGSIRADVRKGRFWRDDFERQHYGQADGGGFESGASGKLRNGQRPELTMDAAREVKASTSNSSITVRLPGSADAIS